MVVLIVLGVWLAVSLPVSLLLGLGLRAPARAPELVGMDGADAVFVGVDGVIRMPLLEPARH